MEQDILKHRNNKAHRSSLMAHMSYKLRAMSHRRMLSSIVIFLLMVIPISTAMAVPPQLTGPSGKSMNTYYMSPFGGYDSFRFYPRANLGAVGTACTIPGLMFYDSSTGILELCSQIPTVWVALGSGATNNGDWCDDFWCIHIDPFDSNLAYIYPKATLSTPINNKTKVGIGTSVPYFRMHLGSNSSIVSTSTIGAAESLTTNVTNTFFMWYPRKAFLFAGTSSSNWNDSNNPFPLYSTVFGLNQAISSGASMASILGGEQNQISTASAAVSIIGGFKNQIYGTTDTNSTIVGGSTNKLENSTNSFIGGGENNEIHNSTDTGIPGGNNNTVKYVDNSTILGGNSNTMTGTSSKRIKNFFIGGGDSNSIKIASAAGDIFYSSIGGGHSMDMEDSSWSFIGGGNNHELKGNYSVVLGGSTNTVGDTSKNFLLNYDVIGGGRQNSIIYDSAGTTANDYNTILGGIGNSITVNTLYSAIGGGQSNLLTSTANYSSIISGYGAQINNSSYSTIGTGDLNTQITGGANYSTILNGHTCQINNASHHSFASGNTVTGNAPYSFTFGQTLTNSAFNSFLFGFTLNAANSTLGNVHDVFVVHGDYTPLPPTQIMHVGFGTTDVAESDALKVNGDVRISRTGAGIATLTIANMTATGGNPLNRSSAVLSVGQVGRDLAEIFGTTEEVEAGDILVADEHHVGQLKRTTTPYDKKVIGIVSASPAIFFEGQKITMGTKPENFVKGKNPPVALSGRVMCKISLENGPVAYGDLITTSSTAGYGMKADRNIKKSLGKVVGHALEPFNGGPNGEKTGMITVLVTLH